jgi:hypothetical protein
MSGMFRSSSTTSTLDTASRSMASRPLLAWSNDTLPTWRYAAMIMRRIVTESSTTRIVFDGKIRLSKSARLANLSLGH